MKRNRGGQSRLGAMFEAIVPLLLILPLQACTTSQEFSLPKGDAGAGNGSPSDNADTDTDENAEDDDGASGGRDSKDDDSSGSNQEGQDENETDPDPPTDDEDDEDDEDDDHPTDDRACDSTCGDGEDCCEGQCVDQALSVDHCGGCGVTCQFDHAEASCDEGQCTFRCSPGFVDCDGNPENGCELEWPQELDGPRLKKPTLGSFSGNLHGAAVTGALAPHFTWEEATLPGCGAAHYELQVDDSCGVSGFQDCKFESPELDVRTDTPEFVSVEDLPVSTVVPVGARYYWRVRSCDERVGCSKWSDVRYLDVGRDRQDVTGDGYPDLVVQGESGKYALFLGKRDLGRDSEGDHVAIQADRVFEQNGGPPTSPVRFVGDVDGDGFNDFVASGPDDEPIVREADPAAGTPAYSDVPRLLFFGAKSVDAIQVLTFTIPRWNAGWGNSSAAGDFNGDGYADLLASKGIAYKGGDMDSEQIPAAALFWGGPDARLKLTLGPLIFSPAGVRSDYFASASDSGDFNGDGLPDLLLTDPTEEGVVIILGGKMDLSAEILTFDPSDPSAPILAVKSDCLPSRVAVADSDADGFDDFALACTSPHRVMLYRGASSLPKVFAIGWSPPGGVTEDTELDVAFGDLNADRYPDLLMSWATIQPGGVDLDAPVVPVDWIGSQNFVGMADANGDGLVDIVIAPTTSSTGFWARGTGTLHPLADPYTNTSVLRIGEEGASGGVGR